MFHKKLIAGFAFLALSVVVNAQVDLPKVPLRIVVLTESDGVNPATSHKQIERQVMQLRNDAARHGLNLAFLGTTFEADSQKRQIDMGPLANESDSAAKAFPSKADAIVIYVTGLNAPATAGRNRFLLLTPRPRADSYDSSEARRPVGVPKEVKDSAVPPLLSGGKAAEIAAYPVIVIDATEFGGEGCGQGRDLPCRTLSLALAETLISHAADEATRSAAGAMKTRAEKSQAME